MEDFLEESNEERVEQTDIEQAVLAEGAGAGSA